MIRKSQLSTLKKRSDKTAVDAKQSLVSPCSGSCSWTSGSEWNALPETTSTEVGI